MSHAFCVESRMICRPYLSDRSILDAAAASGHRFRQRQLGPVQTIHLFVLQVLCFNTAMTHLRHLAAIVVTAPTYCRARMRLPLAMLQQLLRQSSTATRQSVGRGEPWHGLRVYLVDGSSTITPDTPDSQNQFGQPRGCKVGCGFPVPKLLALFDAFSGLIVELLAFPLYTHEQSRIWMLHPLLGAGDLLVGDRGFCSFAHLAMLAQRGVLGLFRLHQKQIVDFRPHRRVRRKGERGRPGSRFVKRLGYHDQIVEWSKPANKPKWMSQDQYDAMANSVLVRELRYHLPCKGQRTRCVTIATTLLAQYTKAGHCRAVPGSLDGRDALCRAQDHAAHAETQEHDRRRREEGAGYLLPGIQPGAHGDAPGPRRGKGVAPDRISFIDTVRWLLGRPRREQHYQI